MVFAPFCMKDTAFEVNKLNHRGQLKLTTSMFLLKFPKVRVIKFRMFYKYLQWVNAFSVWNERCVVNTFIISRGQQMYYTRSLLARRDSVWGEQDKRDWGVWCHALQFYTRVYNNDLLETVKVMVSLCSTIHLVRNWHTFHLPEVYTDTGQDLMCSTTYHKFLLQSFRTHPSIKMSFGTILLSWTETDSEFLHIIIQCCIWEQILSQRLDYRPLLPKHQPINSSQIFVRMLKRPNKSWLCHLLKMNLCWK